MLSSKLFAGLAGVAFSIAMLNRYYGFPRVNLLLSLGRVAFPPYYWLSFVALVCIVLAVMYFSISLLARCPTNKSVGLASFLLVAISFAVWMIFGILSVRYSLSTQGIVALFVTEFAFCIGVLLALLNLILAGVRSWRLSF